MPSRLVPCQRGKTRGGLTAGVAVERRLHAATGRLVPGKAFVAPQACASPAPQPGPTWSPALVQRGPAPAGCARPESDRRATALPPPLRPRPALQTLGHRQPGPDSSWWFPLDRQGLRACDRHPSGPNVLVRLADPHGQPLVVALSGAGQSPAPIVVTAGRDLQAAAHQSIVQSCSGPQAICLWCKRRAT